MLVHNDILQYDEIVNVRLKSRFVYRQPSKEIHNALFVIEIDSMFVQTKMWKTYTLTCQKQEIANNSTSTPTLTVVTQYQHDTPIRLRNW